MKELNYSVLKESGYRGYYLESAPEKVMQFGEGNFLRGFVNYWFDIANEKAGWNGKCCLIQPTARSLRRGTKAVFNNQDCLYTLYLRGTEHGQKVDTRRVISSASRCLNPYLEEDYQQILQLSASDDLEYVVSNTTEAGIIYDSSCRFEDRPADSFPGKLTQVLYHRWKAGKPGLVILSCELIDNNGDQLRHCVDQYITQWGLEEEFRTYIHSECTFCNTLVDRIVPGAIRDKEELARLEEENGYRDDLAVVGEVFGVWNIEGPRWLEEKLPFKAAGVNCPVVPDVTPYKKRKVRILNGAHTGFVLGAYLAGQDIVRDCMFRPEILGYMNKMLFDEILPILPLPEEDIRDFAAAVQDRFNNPFIDHALLSISLNSTSKWRARNLPSLLEYVARFGTLPACLAMSFAAYIGFYANDILELSTAGLLCRRPKGDTYTCQDDRWVLEFYWEHKDDSPEDLIHTVMTNTQMWGMDLTEIPGFEEATRSNLDLLRREGALAAYAACL